MKIVFWLIALQGRVSIGSYVANVVNINIQIYFSYALDRLHREWLNEFGD